MSLRRIMGVFAVATVALLLGALPAEAAPNYPPKPPTISISQTRVAVNGFAVVKVTGCTPSAAATVTVGPSTGGPYRPTANPAGIVTQKVTFDTLGTNTVTVTCAPNVDLHVTVEVVASHAIWADHTTVEAGGKVTVSASGYAPSSTVTLTVTSHNGASVPSTTAVTDATGVASATLSFPNAGTYSVQVLGLTVSGAQLDQTITITVLGAVMPHTGADFVPFSLGGAGLLLAGFGLVLGTRRRRHTSA